MWEYVLELLHCLTFYIAGMKYMSVLNVRKENLKILGKFQEYFNSLYTNIRLDNTEARVISITSVDQKEGKTTIATNLAVSLATLGYKTMLLDMDIRNSDMLDFFEPVDRLIGVTDYLADVATLSTCIHNTNIEKLSVITAGSRFSSPAVFLQSRKFKEMMLTLRQDFNYVIVDTPAIGLATDAINITQICDASILVTEVDKIRQETLKRAEKRLERTRKPLLGIVLNKYKTKHPRLFI